MIFFKILKKLAEFALKIEKSIFLSPIDENLKGKKNMSMSEATLA
jgi:hypothetical protein